MSHYYCLIAGLPDLSIDDTKRPYTVSAFKEEVLPQLSEADRTLFEYYFNRYDNLNLLALLRDKESSLDERGILGVDELETILAELRENDQITYPGALPYFESFLRAYQSEQPLYEGLLWEDQLASLYYHHAMRTDNEFVAQWFAYNLNISNILIAISARRHGFDASSAIIGNNEVAIALRTSTSRDWGLTGTIDYFEAVQRIADTPDFYERERKIDQLRWKWIDDAVFFHYFTIERVFAYLLQLDILQRWGELNREEGEKTFRTLISTLKKEVEVPQEFQ